MEHKTFSLGEFKALGNKDDPGSFEALVAVFGNVDAGGDRVQRGAFKRSLCEWAAKGRSVPVLWSHDPESVPIGVITEAVENTEGLRVKAKLLIDDHPQARAVYAAMKAGALHEFSFGYSARDHHAVTENGKRIRVLKDLDLAEVSPVFRGMNPATRLMGVKSDLQSQRDAIEAKIAALTEESKQLAEAIETVDELPEQSAPDEQSQEPETPSDPPPDEGGEQEQDDNPEPNPAPVAGEEAMARIRALQAIKPEHLE